MFRISANEVLCNLGNAAVVIGIVAMTAVGAVAETPVTPAHYDSFSCVRPVYATSMVIRGGTPQIVREWTGFVPCHESYESDHQTGLMIFPEA
jgi:hypothetical protein